MSLNGLDAPAVVEAYNSAIAEAGGWFFLKYVSRDSLELLAHGKGGVHEARSALADYTQLSPLYGLLIYRRRKVLIQFIPEGTSRLLQARTVVHAQEFLQKFSPYETLLEISNADDLNDTSLAASFPLHTASSATSASSNRLQEISEDGEEHGAAARRPSLPSTQPSRWKTDKRATERTTPNPERQRNIPPTIRISESTSPLTSPLGSPGNPSVSQHLAREESGQRSIASLASQPSLASSPSHATSDKSTIIASSASGSDTPVLSSPPPTASEKPTEVTPQSSERSSHDPAPHRRSVEVQKPSGRPSMSEGPQQWNPEDPYDLSYLDAPKLKLGPRPVSELKRTTAPTVAAIPANLRASQKKQAPQQQQPPPPAEPSISKFFGFSKPAVTSSHVPAPPPIPDIPEYTPRPVSRGSIKSMPSRKSTGMTPDKLRLMKAVELRKKQLRKSNPPQTSATLLSAEEAVPEVPQMPSEAPSRELQLPANSEERPDEVSQAHSKKADSGIEMEYDESAHRDDEHSGDISTVHPPPAEDVPTLQQLERGFSDNPSLSADVPKTKPGEHAAESTHEIPEAIDTEPMASVTEPLQEPLLTEDLLLGDSNGFAGIQNQHPQVPSIMMEDGSQPLTHSRQASRNDAELQLVDSDQREGSEARRSSEMDSSSGLDIEPVVRRQNSNLAKRRRGLVEPLQIEPQADSELSSDDDDELLEELHSATLQEARPMIMKTPVSPAFPRRPSELSVNSDLSVPSLHTINIRRSTANTMDRADANTENAWLPKEDTQPQYPELAITPPQERFDTWSGLRRNVSSGISKRYQALAEMSMREHNLPAAEQPAATENETSPRPTWRERKGAVRSPPTSRTNSIKAVSRFSARASGGYGKSPQSNSYSPESTPVYNVQHDPTATRDSISVTARIVRWRSAGENEDTGAGTDGSKLQQSQLVINHNRASAAKGRNADKPLPPINTDQANDRASVTTSSPEYSRNNDRSSAEYRTMHSASRRSFGRHKQAPMSPITPSADDFPPPPMLKSSSTTSIASSADEQATIKSSDGSRTSRWLKRMSNLGSSSNKDKRKSGARTSSTIDPAAASTLTLTSAQPSSTQHPDRRTSSSTTATNTEQTNMPPALTVGDLNVQFPDSLLWKRRHVTLTSTGDLVFTNPNDTAPHPNASASTKRFRLTAFKCPYLPDLDQQELPHSIWLDFATDRDGADGGYGGGGGGGMTVQIACEDKEAQKWVWGVLRRYWRVWRNGGMVGGEGGHGG